jgi:hypothetical protein
MEMVRRYFLAAISVAIIFFTAFGIAKEFNLTVNGHIGGVPSIHVRSF